MLSADKNRRIWSKEDAGVDEEMMVWGEREQRRQEDEDQRLNIVTPEEEIARMARAQPVKTFGDHLEDLFYEKASDMTEVQKRFVDGRKQMSAAMQKSTTNNIMKGVKVIYPAPDDDITIVPKTEYVTELARQVTESGDRISHQLLHILTREASQEGEIFGNAADIIDNDRRLFWEIQNRVNFSSAVTLSYSEACTVLNLDLMHPSISSRPSKAADQPPILWELKSHQVTALAWFKKVCESDLHGGLCSDEMGLGKTITALSYLQHRFTEETQKYTSPEEPTQSCHESMLSADNMEQITAAASALESTASAQG